MDNIFIHRMRKNRQWFLKISLIYGAVFTFCLYKNMSGITFPLITAALPAVSVLFLKKVQIPLQKGTVRYFAGIMLLGISTVLTDSGFFHFFNCVGIILLFMMAMAHQLYRDDEWGFTEYVKKFFIMVGAWITSVGEPFHKIGKKTDETCVDKKKKSGRYKYAGAVLYGVLAAGILLLIVIPLLMMSDQIFSRIFTEIFRFFSPVNVFRNIDLENIFGILFTFCFGVISLYAFFAGLFKMGLGGKDEKSAGKASFVTGITFAGILAAVYVFYSGIQILFLFLRLDSGLPEGVTYSRYAHEGFWQLLAVSLINFAAVLICARIFEDSRILKILLSVISACTCIMILSAAYRMMLYVNEYNLTFLRVLVLWFLGVLMIIFFGVIYSIYRKNFGLFRYITAVVSVCYILFSFSHADALIAGYNIENTEELNENDLYYLLWGLSQDAAPQIAGLADAGEMDFQTAQSLDTYFENIRFVNEDMGIRSWNYSRAEALKAAEEWTGN